MSHEDMKNKSLHHVHDKGYKELYSNREVLLDLLCNMLKLDWAQELTADNLELTDDSFVTSDYSEVESDLVYRVKLGDKEAIVFVLLEFQSTVDYRMPVRLLMYLTEILRRYMKAAEFTAGNSQISIPAVFPIVLYNGATPWSAKTSLRDITQNGAAYGGNILDFSYSLIDINHTYTPEELLANDCISSIIMLLDRQDDLAVLIRRLGEIVKNFDSLTQGKNRQLIADWVSKTTNPIIADNIVSIINTDKKEAEKMVSNLSTVYERSMQSAEEKGIERGRTEERVRLAREMSGLGIDFDLIAKTLKLPPDEVRKLLQ